MIKIEGLYFAHPGRAELYGGLNLDLKATDNILLKGDNGCGKSTLLKLITGLLLPQKGCVAIAGKQIKALNAAIFAHILYQAQNTADNLLGINPQHDWEIWRLSIPNLPNPEKDANLLFSAHSSGMLKQCSQRVLPYLMDKFWILDEPLAALDSEASESLQKLLLTKSRKHPGMLIVAHELSGKEGIFSRILELKHGQMLEQSP